MHDQAAFKHSIRTRYAETGQDGIIHHSAYVIYLEVARMEFLKTIGCDITALEKQAIFCPVIDLSLRYMKPLYSLEDIDVLVAMESFSKVRFRLNYQIVRHESQIAEGSVAHCFTNSVLKPIPIPDEFLTQFRDLALIKTGEKLSPVFISPCAI